MRERLAKVRIEAATLAGGAVNQDYYAYGETYALVLDGASSFLPEKTSIDAVTYVNALGKALAARLKSCQLGEIADTVADAIEEVTQSKGLSEQNSPSSTVVIAKWNNEKLVSYVLGDSFFLTIDKSKKVSLITDNRMAEFGDEFRREYQSRLISGSGFDEMHGCILKKLQKIQKKYRNSSGGYWIASALPAAAKHALIVEYNLIDVDRIVLASDGGYSCIKPHLNDGINNLEDNKIKEYLKKQWTREKLDPKGYARPRSKMHDDKTIVSILF